MAAPRVWVKVDSNFKQVAAQTRRAEDRAMRSTVREIEQIIQHHPSQGYRTQQIQKVNVRISRTKGGLIGAIFSEDWRAPFFEWGTEKRRRKPIKSARKRPPRTGVKALGFMAAGRRRGRALLRANLQQNMSRLR